MTDTAMLDYLQRVEAFVETWRSVLTDSEVAEVRHFIEHDEPAEGLRSLAWIIHEGDKPATVAQKRALLELSYGFVTDEDMPPSFIDVRVSK